MRSSASFAVALTFICLAHQPAVVVAAPTDLDATAVSATSVQLTWTGSGDGLSVERSSVAADSDFLRVAWLLPAGTTSWLDHGLDTDTTYYYRLRESDDTFSNVDLATTDSTFMVTWVTGRISKSSGSRPQHTHLPVP